MPRLWVSFGAQFENGPSAPLGGLWALRLTCHDPGCDHSCGQTCWAPRQWHASPLSCWCCCCLVQSLHRLTLLRPGCHWGTPVSLEGGHHCCACPIGGVPQPGWPWFCTAGFLRLEGWGAVPCLPGPLAEGLHTQPPHCNLLVGEWPEGEKVVGESCLHAFTHATQHRGYGFDLNVPRCGE